jgi:hypothetical protein
MMAFPRVGDITIVDLLLGHGIQGAALQGYNQCRLKHEAVFLSDIAMAAGTHVDPQCLQPPTRKGQFSFYIFPHEEPTWSDWTLWEQLWRDYCHSRLWLPCSLRAWQASGHCIWEWLYDEEHDKVYQQSRTTFHVFLLWRESCTHSGNLYELLGESNIMPLSVIPISVNTVLPAVVARFNQSTRLPSLWPSRLPFWDYLASCSGDWMWDFVSAREDDSTWIQDGLILGTLILSTDGS